LIDSGVVLVGGAIADKPARMVAESDHVLLGASAQRFVSRGGEKLDAALERFGVSVEAKRCLDAGASTGGFTDCLLRRGAAQVYAVDVARGQIDLRLRNDPRVTVVEKTNIRHASIDALGGVRFDVVVADLSFISLTAVLPLLVDGLAARGADLVLLVKPQFEVGREIATKGRGVVRDPSERRQALRQVASALEATGATIMGAMASPLLGPAGNAEFLIHARRGSAVAGNAGVAAGALAEVVSSSDRAAGPTDSTDSTDSTSIDRMIDLAVAEAPDHASSQTS
jgi:23S rRNA (cytidine1920-2'-O)/16S rRNA (cytidine1409-2'-O)-methyltransferase